MCDVNAPEYLEGFQRRVLNASYLLRRGKKDDCKAWNTNDAGDEEVYDKSLDHLEVHLGAHSEIVYCGDGRAKRVPAVASDASIRREH